MTLKCTILKCYKLFKTPILQKTCELAASTNILLMQPFSGVLTKGFSENMKQIYRKTPMLIAVILLIALLLILSQKKEKLYGQLRKKKRKNRYSMGPHIPKFLYSRVKSSTLSASHQTLFV